MSDLDGFWVHTATVETYQGAGAYGDLFAAPVTITCFADDARRVVRNASGEQVVSESTLYTDASNAALFTTDTRVTIWPDGVNTTDSDDLAPPRPSRVIKANANDSGPLGLPDHVAVTLM